MVCGELAVINAKIVDYFKNKKLAEASSLSWVGVSIRADVLGLR